MRDNLGNADREKKQDMQEKPVHGFFYHWLGILKAAPLFIIFLFVRVPLILLIRKISVMKENSL